MQRTLLTFGVGAVIVGAAVIGWSKLGGGTPAIEAVPADAHAVAFFDVLEIHETYTSDRMQSFLGEIDPELARIDEALDRRVGMTISGDVLPWVGTTAAVWLQGGVDSGQGCLVVSARDRAAADDFVDAVLSHSEEGSHTARDVDGGTLYDFEHEDEGVMTFGRVGGVVLVCGGEGAADASVEAMTSGSMADTPEVAALVDQGSLIVGWVDLPALAEMAGGAEDVSVTVDPGELAPMVTTFDVTDQGFEWSAHTDSAFGRELADAALAGLLPANTFLAILGGAPELDLPFDELPDEEVADLLQLLDGPMVLGMSSEQTLLGGMADAPLNIVIGLGTSNPPELADGILGLAGELLDVGEDAFVRQAYDGGVVYSFEFPFLGELAAMAVSDEYLVISATAEAAKGEGPRLVDSVRWAEATTALGDEMVIGFYFDPVLLRSLDLTALMDLASSQAEGRLPEGAPNPQEILAAEQLTLIVAGSSIDGEAMTVRLVALIDWDE